MTGEVVEEGTGRPLPGVAVSDGLAVVTTDGEGRFALDRGADAEFVAVTVPATHRALGDGWFLDVRDGGPSSGHHVFTLAARDEPPAGRVRFLHVTDLHVSLDRGEELRRMLEAGVPVPDGIAPLTSALGGDELRADLAEAVRREAPEFVAATGDLANHGRPDELAAYLDAVGGLGVPVAHVPGNHDYLSGLGPESIVRFVEWLRTEGRHRAGEPYAAFQEWMFGGDWRRPDSGRHPWLDAVGPPHWSFDWGPVHFVVYDSEARHRYGEGYPQDRWLAADLAALPPGTPVVVLLHFAEPVTFWDERFEGTGARLLGSFAGHWHANRRLEHRGAVHHVTANTGFAGYDHSARGYRVVEVDAGGIRSWWRPLEDPGVRGVPPVPPVPPVLAAETRAIARVSAARTKRGAVWETELPGLPTIGSPVVAGGVVVLAVERADSSGALVALDAASGETRWVHDEPSAVTHSPAIHEGAVVAVSVTGAVVALDLATGAERWRAQLGDPGVRWCFAAPTVTGDGAVVAGGSGHLAALDVADGSVRWARTDLAPDDWPTAWGSPAVAGDTVVAAFANERAHLVALDAATGETHWLQKGHELAAPCSSPVVAGDRVVATTVNGWLVAWSLETGARLWSAPLGGPWPVATPAVDGERAYALDSAGVLSGVRLDDGTVEWQLPCGPARQARRPYGREPAGHPSSPLLAGGHVWAVSAGGRLVAVDPAKGVETWALDLGVACWSSPAPGGGGAGLLVPTGAGTLLALAPEGG